MTKYKYINPFTDYDFKLIFGTEANKDLLIDFLNAMFTFRSPVTEVQFANVEQLPETDQERKAVYDIFCTDAMGNHFIVEMQKGKIAYFKDRALVYLTFPIRAMTQRGDWNYQLNEIFYLNLLDFVYDNTMPAKLERLVQLTDQYGDIFYDKLQLKFIQLPVFEKKLVNLQSRYDQWLYFLKHLESLDVIPDLFMTDAKFNKVLKIAEIAKLSKEEAIKYNVNRTQYAEIKGMSDAAYADGQQDAAEKYEVLLEEANKKAAQLVLSLRRLIESGISKEIIAAANQITVAKLDEMLGL